MKVKKEQYSKLAFKGPLAIEDYCDMNEVPKEVKKVVDDMHLQQRKYIESQKQMVKERDELVSKLSKVIDTIGTDKFTIYDDGGIVYND